MLAFCTYGQALLTQKPEIGGDLLTFVGTVARLARDHPGPAWAAYEQMFRGKAVADPTTRWNKLDQEVWALSTVKASGPTQLPQKRRVPASSGTRALSALTRLVNLARLVATAPALSTELWLAPPSPPHQRRADLHLAGCHSRGTFNCSLAMEAISHPYTLLPTTTGILNSICCPFIPTWATCCIH